MGASESMTADGPVVLALGLILIGIEVARRTCTAIPRSVRRSPIIAGIGIELGYDYYSL